MLLDLLPLTNSITLDRVEYRITRRLAVADRLEQRDPLMTTAFPETWFIRSQQACPTAITDPAS